MATISKEKLNGVLGSYTLQYQRMKDFVIWHSYQPLALDYQAAFIRECERFLLSHDVGELREVLVANPDLLYGEIDLDVRDNILSWIENQYPKFELVNLPEIKRQKEEKVRQELQKQTIEERQALKLQKKLEQDADKQARAEQLAGELLIKPEVLARLQSEK